MDTTETAEMYENEKKAMQLTTYYEKQIGKTLFRVTCIYKGETPLSVKLEDLIINKLLREEDFKKIKIE